MNMNKKNGKIFWKLLDKIDLKNKDKEYVSNISMSRWVEHFKKVLIGNTNPTYPADCTNTGSLDYPITSEELKDSAYILKNEKACGIDAISNEMLRCVMETNPNTLLSLFNAFLDGKTSDIQTAMLTPVHKKGVGQIQNSIEVYH